MMDVSKELTLKRERVIDFLKREGLDAVLISKHENIAWITAGKVDIRIGVLKETGAASLLLTKDNAAYYLTTNNEAPRLADEEFAGLDWKPIVQRWYANDVAASIAQAVPWGVVGTDAPFGSLKPVDLQAVATRADRLRDRAISMAGRELCAGCDRCPAPSASGNE